MMETSCTYVNVCDQYGGSNDQHTIAATMKISSIPALCENMHRVYIRKATKIPARTVKATVTPFTASGDA